MHRHGAPVGTDTIYSSKPSIDDFYTCAYLFVGTKSLVSDVCCTKVDNRFFNILEKNTCMGTNE